MAHGCTQAAREVHALLSHHHHHHHQGYSSLKTNYYLRVPSLSEAGLAPVLDQNRLFSSVVIDTYRPTLIYDLSVSMHSPALHKIEVLA